MKKKIWIPIVCVLVILILFLPVRITTNDDGTTTYSALTYKVVKWNRVYDDGIFTDTKLYFGADAYKSTDELFKREIEDVVQTVIGEYVYLDDSVVTIFPIASEWERAIGTYIDFDIKDLPIIGTTYGSLVEVKYKGSITKGEHAVINAVDWSIYKESPRMIDFNSVWLNEKVAKPVSSADLSDAKITLIYKNCFFAYVGNKHVKINGSLSDDWCVGDYFEFTCENLREDSSGRIECDLLTIGASNSRPVVYDKPVIYLYPETKTDVTVSLDYDGELTCTYPEYNNGWSVTASPDGTLTDANGQTYNYLYWEGESDISFDFSEGFCVKGEDTAEFLEGSLESLGLNRKEANEFIIYWLPMMQNNEYNVISFQKESYTEMAKLTVSPTPDTLIRVFMAWKASDEYVDISPQILTAPERQGFTVVEWGGSEVK